jgi:hypothetical protein
VGWVFPKVLINLDLQRELHGGLKRPRRRIQGPATGLTLSGNPLMMDKLAFAARRPAVTQTRPVARKANLCFTLHLLPVRSTVGQLPLEQHIGVRIPDGQPIQYFLALP